MFRRILLLKGGLRLGSNNTALHSLQSVKWSSSVTAANSLNKINGEIIKEYLVETAAKEQHSSGEWVVSKLDLEISSATDIPTLLSTTKQSDFGSRNAVNVVNVLGQWAQKGQLSAADYEKLETRNKLEELLCGGDLGTSILSVQEVRFHIFL